MPGKSNVRYCINGFHSAALHSFLALAILSSIPTDAKGDVAPDFVRSWSTSQKPASIVVDIHHNNVVYVAGEGGIVEKYSSDGVFLRSWSASGPLNGIGTDAFGNVYVAEFQTCRIKKFTPDGVLILLWGTCGSTDSTFSLTSDVSVDGSGNVHVLDYRGRVLVFSSTGAFVRNYASQGSGDGQLNNCRGLTIDQFGSVFVADTENRGGRIQKFTTAGQYVRLWSEGMQNPFDVAVDPIGNVYVPDYWGHRMMKFTNNGQLLVTWGSQGQGLGQFQNPRGVATDSFGNIYVADTEMFRIQKFGYEPTLVQRMTWSAIKTRYH